MAEPVNRVTVPLDRLVVYESFDPLGEAEAGAFSCVRLFHYQNGRRFRLARAAYVGQKKDGGGGGGWDKA